MRPALMQGELDTNPRPGSEPYVIVNRAIENICELIKDLKSRELMEIWRFRLFVLGCVLVRQNT